MFSLFRFSAAAATVISAPALAQIISVPPIGVESGMSNMPKTADTIPDRIRTLDLGASGGMHVRSDLADKPDPSHSDPIKKEGF